MTELDHTIFLYLNSLHSPFFDNVMWLVSNRVIWIPLYLFMVYMLAIRYGKRIWIILLFVPVLILITDQGTEWIKNLVQRPRPCHEPSLEGLVHTVRGHCGGMYGFVSGHAANSFGLASFTAPLLQKKWYSWSIFIWAAIVAYSRIYLGVHYPSDVVCGALLGVIAGTGLAYAARKTYQNIKK